VSGRKSDADHFGRRDIPEFRLADRAQPDVLDLVAELLAEAADYVEVVRRLWDSWEDDAEIRDAATGRFIDRDKLHYVDFRGKWFSVKGPSITPRPPQGQPLVTVLAHGTASYRLAASVADLVFVTPQDADEALVIERQVRAAQGDAGREEQPLHVFADLVVFLGDTEKAALERRERLDGWAESEFVSDAAVFVGTPAQLADQLLDWSQAGLSGFRLRPAAIPDDLTAITRGLVPELQARGGFRRSYADRTLRGRLGLSRPANRYASEVVSR
jgi:alkanesulfonate monooxygenase SsuD/methylene tetrahydromethanopterin reductase-like flavin-dependent oxidoreductase (luciferase family)